MAAKKKKKLTIKEKLFVKAYLSKKLNGTKSAISAGYSKKSAATIATENLKKPHIIEALQDEYDRLVSKGTIAEPEEVLAGYTNDQRFDPRKLYKEDGTLKDVVDLDDETALALSGLEITETTVAGTTTRKYKYKLPDKVKNRDSLSKYHGLFIEKKEIQHNFPEGVKIITNVEE